MRENMEHALIGSREDQSLPYYVRTYSEGTRRFQIKSLCYKPTELKPNLTELNNKFKNDDWCDNQIRPDYSIESIKRVVNKALRLIAQNEIQNEFSTEKSKF